MKKLGLSILGLLLAFGGGIANSETITSVTQVSYDAVGRPQCTATRMNPVAYATALPTDACTLGAEGAYGPDRVTKTVYDAAGQVIEIKRAVGVGGLEEIYATLTYTKNGLKASEADAKGNLTRYKYDEFDRLSYLYYPSPSTTNYSLQPCAATPETYTGVSGCGSAQAYTSRHAPDLNNPKLNNSAPLLGISSTTDYEAFTYDPNSNLKSHRRRNGATINYIYDALNRQTKADLPVYAGNTDGTSKDIYTAYDLAGHILSKRFASATGTGVSYEYDGLGRVTSTTDYYNRTISYEYNAANARTKMTMPKKTASGTDADFLSYALDNLNRVTAVSHTSGTTTLVMYSQRFNSLGQRRKLMRGSITNEDVDLACTSATNVTCYGYDAVGRLSSLKNDFSGNPYDIEWTFSAYNPAGQIETWGASSTVFDHRTVAAVSENSTYDGLNRDAGIVALSGGYDASGNMTNDGTRIMVYDAENRLLSAASTQTDRKTALSYDPEGRLMETLVTVISTGATSTQERFVYDGTQLIGVYNVNGGQTSRFVHGTGVDDPLVWFNGAGVSSPRYLWKNYQGSVIAYSTAAGVLGEFYTYDPYGEPASAVTGDTQAIETTSAWSGAVRFRYTGQMSLGDVRLYYYKARVYDPKMGRFLQTDPIGSKDDLDLYAYVGGDPVNRSDPTGLCDWCFRVEKTTNPDGTVRYESPGWLRALVPGQIALDKARSDYENGNKGAAALDLGAVGLNVVATAMTGGTNRAAAPILSSKAIIESAAVNPTFKSGDIILRTFSTSGGKLEVMGQASYAGTAARIDGLMVYGQGGEQMALGARQMLQLTTKFSQEFKAMGFESLRITGTRLTGAAPGKAIDITLDLTKQTR